MSQGPGPDPDDEAQREADRLVAEAAAAGNRLAQRMQRLRAKEQARDARKRGK